MSREISDEEIINIIDEVILRETQAYYISTQHKKELREELFNSIRRLDILQEIIDNKNITEIMINGANQIFVEQEGYLTLWHNKFESEERLQDVIQQIAAGANRIINELSPIVDARLSDGSRVNIVMKPIALNGPIVTIRKFPDMTVTMDTLIEWGALTREVAGWLDKLVKSGYNIFVSGGTGSGKTTFLNAMSNYIPLDERIITIEDSAELQIKSIPNLVRLETRNANVEGKNEISIRHLIKASLRMRPNRIIIGEVRGAEALDLLGAMNTGHDGSMSTGHGNSSIDMLSRLETMVLMGTEMPITAIRKQIASAIDIIIQLGRLRDKSRKVLEISEVLEVVEGEIQLNPLYMFEEERGIKGSKVIGELKSTGNVLTNIHKLQAAGYGG